MKLREAFQLDFSELSDELEANGLFPEFLPFSSLRLWIQEGTIYEKVWQSLPIGRLNDIKALSFLSYHGPKAEEQYFIEFQHARLDHSLVVAMVAEAIASQNCLSQKETNTLVVAGLIHDIATPAHGDATIKVDPDNLSEEKFWWEVIDEKGMDLLAEHGITKEEMDNIIKNGGLLGKILDVADRITYVAKDLHNVIAFPKKPSLSLDPYAPEIYHLLSLYPEIGNIYKNVGVDRKSEEVYFTDPKELGVFLYLRSLLHQKLYYHPVSIGRDFFIARLTQPLYSPDGSLPLTPAKLRRMTDHQLEEVLGNYYSPLGADPVTFFSHLINWFPQYQKFETHEEAEKAGEKLMEDNSLAVIGIVEGKGFDPGTDYKVLVGHHLVPFCEVDPVVSSLIKRIEQSTRGFFLFYVDVSDDSRFINRLLKRVCQKT